MRRTKNTKFTKKIEIMSSFFRYQLRPFGSKEKISVNL